MHAVHARGGYNRGCCFTSSWWLSSKAEKMAPFTMKALPSVVESPLNSTPTPSASQLRRAQSSQPAHGGRRVGVGQGEVS